MKKIIAIVLRYADLILFIPILIGLVYHYNQYAANHELHAFTVERQIKPFFGFLQLSMGMVYIRILYALLFNPLYKLLDFSFFQSKRAWLKTLEEKPWIALLLVFLFYAALIIAYAIILNGQ